MTIADASNPLSNPTIAEKKLFDRCRAMRATNSRTSAFGLFAETGLPHRRMEQWKWTDIRAALTNLETPSIDLAKQTVEVPEGACVLIFDGVAWKLPETLPEGVSAHRQSDATPLKTIEGLPLGQLTASMTGQDSSSDFVSIEISGKVEQPIFLDFASAPAETAFARLAFNILPDCSVRLIEAHSGNAAFSSTLIEFRVQNGASVDRTFVQRASTAQSVGITATAVLEEKASFVQTALGFGGKACRVETHVRFEGAEAHAELNSAYLAGDDHHIDFTSHVTHAAPSCTTRQLTKGAVSKGGRGVFQGKFLVPRSIGQFTDADMQHQALLLEDGAEVFAKPELEIYADDVECAHGNTSGQLDEAALFYMRQRGIPAVEARALLTEAFIVEALQTAHEAVRDQMIDEARNFLRAEG